MTKKISCWAYALPLLLLFSACRSRQAAIPDSTALPTAVVAELTRMQDGHTPSVQPTVQSPDTQLSAKGTWQAGLQQQLTELCRDSICETSQLGLCVHDLTDDIPIFSYNATHRMRPASCQKLVTAITALRCLGPDYQLQTRLYIDGRTANGTLNGNVYIVGGMDPLLTAQEVRDMASALRRAGVHRITGRIYKDLTMTDGEPYGWGWCWDDDYGPLSALLVDGKANFDAVWMRQLKAAQVSASHPTPCEGVLPATARLVHTVSHSIGNLMLPIMKESNNIDAECLFYQIAASTGKKRAGRKDAAALAELVLHDAGANAGLVAVADGSGLSLYNYITPLTFVRLLRFAYQEHPLYEALQPALPVAGVDGTLEKRMTATPACQQVWAKTGSVDGISSLSGYARAANGHMLAFSIINQGISNFRSARAFQDQVCITLCR